MWDAATLTNLASNFRKLAELADAQTAAHLREMADEYEELAAQLRVEIQPFLIRPE